MSGIVEFRVRITHAARVDVPALLRTVADRVEQGAASGNVVGQHGAVVGEFYTLSEAGGAGYAAGELS